MMLQLRNLAAALALLVPTVSASDWRTLPLFGADVRCLAIHPSHPETVLGGTANGHVVLSTDGGRHWGDAGDALALAGYVVGALHFDPHDSRRLWAGLQGVWGSGTVAQSGDLGKTWEAAGDGLPEEPVYALSFDPTERGHLYAGTTTGVWKTSDAGKSWWHASASQPLVGNVSSLWVDPDRPSTVIAGTFRRAYKSDDGGRSWRGIFEGMELDSEVFALASFGRELWASTCGWVYQSLDRGEHWKRHKEGLVERRTPSLRPLVDGRILAGTTAGLYVSSDRGRSWQRRSAPDLVVQCIAEHPARPERILLGTEGSGVWISEDAGTTFAPQNEGLTNVRVSAMLAAPGQLFVAVRDGGPLSGIYRSEDGGRSFAREPAVLPAVLSLAIGEHGIYAATEKGVFCRRGATWSAVPGVPPVRVEELSAAQPGSSDTRVVALTGQGAFRTRSATFGPLTLKKGAPVPRSLQPWGGEVWHSGDTGLYREVGSRRDVVPAPFRGGRLLRVGQHMMYWGVGGAFLRDEPSGAWKPIATERCRAIPTGDDQLPFLLITGESSSLYDERTQRLLPLSLPIASRDVGAVLILGERLLVGTSGYGLFEARRPR